MQSIERLCAFPMDEDYEPALDSKVADIKQCTLDGEADHILAARFLKRFLEHDVPWLHVDTCPPVVARASWAVWRAM
jgi:leucyl aminopeptidase